MRKRDASFVLDPFEPACLELERRGDLPSRVRAARDELKHCRACPRDCGVDRTSGDLGICNTGRHAIVSSAYDSIESLRLLDGLIDVYMPDFKFWERATARRLAKAKDYPERAREAISEMHRQVGDLRFGPDGLARRGVLVRHLVMPGQLDESEAIFKWLAEEVSPDTFVNVMAQYRPEYRVGGDARYAEVDRRPDSAEIDLARAAARRAGLWRFAR